MSRPRLYALSVVRSFVTLILCCGWLASAAESASDDAAQKAFDAWKIGDREKALTLISKAITTYPAESRLWNLRAQMYSLLRKREESIQDLTEAIKLEPDSRVLRQTRGEELFKAGRLSESVVDFDKANELTAAFAPFNWQRGIALYLVGRFGDGRKQFELHQTVNTNDVENAVWHYLCTARELGSDAARRKLIPIEGDDRVPMKQIHLLFAGKIKPSEVLEAAEKTAGLKPEEVRQHKFYAHLYLALYYETLSDASKTSEELAAALPLGDSSDFMNDVARVMATRASKAKPDTLKDGASKKP